jgi:thioester reductase-like protein
MATVVVTGFPGFIGSELVARLLARYPVDVHIACLVQDSYRRLAEERIREIERLDETYKGRIHACRGDIRHPNLSLDGQYGFLSDETVEIFHLAAVYDLGVRREVGMAINREGTRHVLDFAAQCPQLRRFHYVSTCYVSGSYPGDFRESDLVNGQRFNNYYEETKYLAEVEVQNRMQAGLPVTIYRPAIVVGDSQTGATQKYDGIYYVLQWLLRQPKTAAFLTVIGDPAQYEVNFVPRDFVVNALVYLSGREGSTGKVYHLSDPRPPLVDEVIDMIAEATQRRVVRVKLPGRLVKGAMNHVPGVAKFVGIEPAAMDYFTQPTRYHCENTLAALAGSGIACPPFASYAPKLVQFMQSHPEISPQAMV